MKLRRVSLAVGVLVIAGLVFVFATRDGGKHDYYPPPDEVWVNIEIDDLRVQETVLWNPLTPTSISPDAFSCIDPMATLESAESGDYKATRSQVREATTPVTVGCDASPLVGEGGVDSVRLLIGTPSGDVDVLEADPAPDEGQPVIWRLSADSPDVEAAVAER